MPWSKSLKDMEGKERLKLARSLRVPSVQELVAKESLSKVPSTYVRHSDEHVDSSLFSLSSKTNFSSIQLPIIDISKLYSPSFKACELQKLHSACRDWGFFQVLPYLFLVSRFVSLSLTHPSTRAEIGISQANFA